MTLKNIFRPFQPFRIHALLYAYRLEYGAHILTDMVVRAGKGNAKAQALLYSQFSTAMYNICLRMTGNKMLAEDLLHDAFILAFKNLQQLKQPEAFGGWLRRLVLNECIRQTKQRIAWDDLQTFHEAAAIDASEWWQEVSPETIHTEIKNLPDGCRQVFVLYVLEDHSHKEIAERLSISEGTSKSQYHRSRILLKERITQKMAIGNG